MVENSFNFYNIYSILKVKPLFFLFLKDNPLSFNDYSFLLTNELSSFYICSYFFWKKFYFFSKKDIINKALTLKNQYHCNFFLKKIFVKNYFYSLTPLIYNYVYF